jgi:hypothetical protein
MMSTRRIAGIVFAVSALASAPAHAATVALESFDAMAGAERSFGRSLSEAIAAAKPTGASGLVAPAAFSSAAFGAPSASALAAAMAKAKGRSPRTPVSIGAGGSGGALSIGSPFSGLAFSGGVAAFPVTGETAVRFGFLRSGLADLLGAKVDEIALAAETLTTPLPAALPLLLTGLLGLGVAARRKRSV